MKYPLLFCTLLYFAITFSSCYKDGGCSPDSDEYQEILNPVYKEVLKSYSGHDTLKFKSETGIIYTFYGKELDSGYTIHYKQHEVCSESKIRQHKKFYAYQFVKDNYATDLQYVVTVSLSDNDNIEFHIIINNVQYFHYLTLPPITNPAYLNNLNIEGNIYNNVIKIYKDNTINTSYLYYSLEDGIIEIFFPDGKTLSKIK